MQTYKLWYKHTSESYVEFKQFPLVCHVLFTALMEYQFEYTVAANA